MSRNRLSLRDFAGPVGDFIGKIDGDNGRIWLNQFKKFLRKEPSWTIPKIPVLKAITIGKRRNVELLLQDLEEKDLYCGVNAREIFRKEVLSRSKRTVKLVAISIEELGLSDKVTLAEAVYIAEGYGLHLCTAEIGFYYRLELTRQVRDEYFVVAMKPISLPHYRPLTLVISDDEDSHSIKTHTYDTVWRVPARFVFVKP